MQCRRQDARDADGVAQSRARRAKVWSGVHPPCCLLARRRQTPSEFWPESHVPVQGTLSLLVLQAGSYTTTPLQGLTPEDKDGIFVTTF